MNPRGDTGDGLLVRRAGQAAEHWVTLTIVEAFHPLAVSQWLVRDPAERAGALYGYFALHVAHALEHGQVHVVEGHGVAVWLVHDALPEPPGIHDYDQQLKTACGPHVDRFRQLDDVFIRHHPTGPSHHHLAFLAVTPRLQRRGVGTALLDTHHAALDDVGLGSYLEASDETTQRYYRERGYVDHGLPIQLPDGPPMWPMWREPRPAGPSGLADGAIALPDAVPSWGLPRAAGHHGQPGGGS